MRKGFIVEALECSNPEDERGPIYSWDLPHSDTREVTVVCRKAGAKFGGHFHKGEDASKYPERLFVAKGSINAVFVADNGQETRIELKQGDILTIYPNTTHTFEAIEDVVMVEARVTLFDPEFPDTYTN